MEEKYRFIENTSENHSFAYVAYDKISSFAHKMGSSQLLQIYYILEGEGYFVQIGKKKKLVKDDLLIVNPLEESGFETEQGGSMTFIGFGVEKKEFVLTSPSNHAITLRPKSSFTRSLLEHIYRLMREGGGCGSGQPILRHLPQGAREIR